MKNIRQSPYRLQQSCRNIANLGSTEAKLNRKFVTEQEQIIQEDVRGVLKFRIQCLEAQLRKALQKQSKLKVQNCQLLSMTVTSCTNSSGASNFIKKVEQTLAKYIGFDPNQKNTPKQQKNGLENEGMSSKRSERSVCRSHSKSISNFSTTSSIFNHSRPTMDINSSTFSKMTKKDIRERLSSVKIMEKHLARQ